jgi:hypothetical protein
MDAVHRHGDRRRDGAGLRLAGEDGTAVLPHSGRPAAGEDARSELRLFGLLPLSGSPPDRTALHKGQIMRYLAEIPWSPDAIVRNRTLEWTGLSNGLRVSHPSVFGRFSVDIEFDADGRIDQVSAPDRPRLENGR